MANWWETTCIEKFLEDIEFLLRKSAFLTILESLSKLAIVVGVIAFIFGENVRRNNEIFTAWQTITSAEGQSGSGGRIEALEFLNSRPLRFPWIGLTEKGWYWDEREKRCKEKRLWGWRWKRQPLIGLSAPNRAYLARIHLCGGVLFEANLREANLGGAKLQKVLLIEANLQEAQVFRANLQEAQLSRANLQEAYLSEANLEKAFLFRANLQEVDLSRANLQEAQLFIANLEKAYLSEANLEKAFLFRANLKKAYLEKTKNLTFKQIKSACFWEEAIYRGEWNKEKKTWEPIEPDNTNYIERLNKDKSSAPEEPVDCSVWE